MLTIKNIAKSYGVETLFSNVSFSVTPGDRLALIGPNGCGKSTLMRILAGVERPDCGSVIFSPPNRAAGYLPQGTGVDGSCQPIENPVPMIGLFTQTATVSQYLSPCGQDLSDLETRVEKLARELSCHPDSPDIQSSFDAALDNLQMAADIADRQPAILAALGLADLPGDFPVTNLSGGQQTRLALSRILLGRPGVLLFDEPTNHLDLEMLAWLEEWLIASPCAVLFVSHDRYFLERVATGVLEMDAAERKVRLFAMTYAEYLAVKETEREEQLRAYGDQQIEIARLKTAARRLRATATFTRGGKSDTNDKFAKGFFANRSLGTVGRAKHIERKIDKILTENLVERPKRRTGLRIEFDESTARGRETLILRDLSVGYGNKFLISGIDRVLGFRSRAAIIGPNGCGKSTLLRTIAGELKPLRGEVRLGSGVKLGVLSQLAAPLTASGTPLTMIMSISNWNETEARAFLARYLFSGDSVFAPLHSLSYGEQSRLALARLVASRCNLLLLDEPLNHLDIPARRQMEEAVLNFPGTLLFVVHDRVFIERVATEVWEIKEGRMIYR